MLSNRTKLSLMQFLLLQPAWNLEVLLEKHGFPFASASSGIDLYCFRNALMEADANRLSAIISEILRTSGDLRNNVSPRYRYDERWRDLLLCINLDGYLLRDQQLVAMDPTIEASAPIEDDLAKELRESNLDIAEQVIHLAEASGEDFRMNPSDYNGCLTKARMALQTLAMGISRVRRVTHPRDFDETSWGQVLQYLRISGLVTQEEEEMICGVFRFVSPGAHRLLGPTEEEMARLGRSLIASMCYFLVKRHKVSRYGG